MKITFLCNLALCALLVLPAAASSNTIRPGQPAPAQPAAQQPQSPAKQSAGQARENQGEQSGSQPQENQDAESAGKSGQSRPVDRGQAKAQETPTPEKDAAQMGSPEKNDAESSRAQGDNVGSGSDKGVKEKALAINALGKLRPDANGKPMIIPEKAEDIAKLDGNWLFDHELKGPNGESLRWDFSLRDGKGMASMVDNKNNRFESGLDAKIEDGVLLMKTGKFTSQSSPNVYNEQYIECRNGAKGAECIGTDGFGEWNGERVFASAKDMNEGARTASSSSGASGSRMSSATEENSGKSAATSEKMQELAADGPEMAPYLMEKAEKASMGTGSDKLASLAGDWRYSQDLARKSDGQNVIMEFHLDRSGKGYSLIRDGSGSDFRANAEAMLMKDGKIRVKTDNYSNGKGKGYFPTFMECAGKPGEDMKCNVSNGWMRSEAGRLVDLASYNETAKQSEMEELLPAAPMVGAENEKESGSEKTSAASRENMDDFFADAAEDANRQANMSGSGKSTSRHGTQGQLVLPKSGNSVTFMNGKWICNTGLGNARTNEPVVLEFSFNKNGKGTSVIQEARTGAVYRASAQASFRNGILRVNTSPFLGRNGQYTAQSITCEDRGGTAFCKGVGGNVSWDADFERR